MARWAGLLACVAAGFAVGAAGVLAWPAGPLAAPGPAARAASCAALGVADGFVVFSDGAFHATRGGGTITGRIAARGNVKLDGVFVGPGAGDEPPTVITGASLSAGKARGDGGTLNGGVRYAADLDVARNFAVTGARKRGAPPFSFADAFQALGLVSDRWSEVPQTPGAQVTFSAGALTFRGTSSGLNVFHVGAADVGGSAANVGGVVIELPGPNASALINVSTNTDLTIAPQYLNVTPPAAADRLIWNLPRATALNVATGVAWRGLILAPNATVNGANHPQLAGQLIASSVPGGEWVLTHTPLAGCPPSEPPPTPLDLQLTALCVDPFGNLAMRLRNTGAHDVAVHWDDLGGNDFGGLVAHAERDEFFNVRGGGARSSIRVSAGRASLDPVAGTGERCAGEITITKRAVGDAPAGRWTVQLTGGDETLTRSAQLAHGQSVTFDALGGYQPGTARFGQVVGGIAYTVTEPDPRGATAAISVNPVEILTGQHEAVAVTNTYPEIGNGGSPVARSAPGAPAPVPLREPAAPEQPTLPPGAPKPPPGPDLVVAAPAAPAADLVVTHALSPRHAQIGVSIGTLTRVRNRGAVAATGVVLRELPQFRAADTNAVARVLSITTTQGRCTHRRPVNCALGTLAPGAEVIVRSRARVQVAAALHSVVLASSHTPESNTTNNTGLSPVTVSEPAPHLRVSISAPSSGRVGAPLRYRVTVTGTGAHGARSVRLCAPPAPTLTDLRAPGTFAYRGGRCHGIRRLPRGHSVSLAVSAVPAAGGSLTLNARATAVRLSRAARASTHVRIAGPTACDSVLRRPRC